MTEQQQMSKKETSICLFVINTRGLINKTIDANKIKLFCKHQVNSLTGINVFSCAKIYWGEIVTFLGIYLGVWLGCSFLFLFSLKLSVTHGYFLFQALLYLG